jgi:hypothetical protein
MAACHIQPPSLNLAGYFHPVEGIHCKKKVSDFPVPSRDITYQTLLGRELLNYSRPEGRVWYK